MKAFDPNHHRCIFPKYGEIVDAAMRVKNLSPADVARRLGIDPSGPAGWRRGFSRNAQNRTEQLEKIIGVKLDMSEATPSEKKSLSEVTPQEARPSDPILPHLEAIAKAHGFKATFTPI